MDMAHTTQDTRESQRLAEALGSLAQAVASNPRAAALAQEDTRQAWIYGLLCGLWGDDPSSLFVHYPLWNDAYRARLLTHHAELRNLAERYDIRVSPPLHRQIEQAVCRERGDDDYYLTDLDPIPHLVEALNLPLGITRIWLATSRRATCTHTPRCFWADLVIATGAYRSATGSDDGETRADWQPHSWTVLKQREVMGLGFDELVEHVRAALAQRQEGFA